MSWKTNMLRTARGSSIAPLLAAVFAGFTGVAAYAAAPDTAAPAETIVSSADSSSQEPVISTNTGATDTSDQTDSGANTSVDTLSGFAQDATRPGTFFPPWSLRSTRPIDPRIRPNAGLRIPRSYYPIAGGPLLYPHYTPEEPDFHGDQPTQNWSVRQSMGFFGVGDDRVSSKFQEYRDVRSGITAGLEGHFRSQNNVLNVVARQIGRKDQDMILDGGMPGVYSFGLNYSETPHNYQFDAKSLYSGLGTGYLSLPDGMQTDLQSSTSNAQYQAKLLGYVNSGADNVDLSLHRQTLGAEFQVIATYPFVLKASASNESREGVRPWSASFGFGNFVEIPWTVDYDTKDLRVVAEFFKPESNIYVNAGYRFSDFQDHVQTLTFDNPGRITDAPGNLNCIFACGPTMGRMALYPSNKYHELNATVAVKNLPWHSTFNAYVSGGFMRQDEELLPFSSNSATVVPMRSPVSPAFNATDPSGLPRRTAESAMDTRTVSMRWTSDFTKKMRVVGQYRFYGLQNNQEPFEMYEFVREDEDIRRPETVGGTYRTVPAEYSRHTAIAEGTYQFSMRNKASVVYTFERMNRELREVEWMNDHKLKLEWDTTLFGALEVKSWLEHTKRSTADYDFDLYNIYQGNPAAHPMLPWLLKFDESPYDKNELQVMATYALTDASTISTHFQAHNTDFNVTDLHERSMTATGVTTQTTDALSFGVRNESMSSFGIDYTWAPTQYLSIFAEGGVEERAYEQVDRQWTVNGISDPYTRQRTQESHSNWEADVRNRYLTAGFGGEISFIPDRLKLALQWVYSKSDGRHDYYSAVGTATVDDVNVFVPQPFEDVDDTTFSSFNPELTYDYNEHISLAAGYQFERWTIDDYNYKGFTYVPLYTTGVALLMNGLLPEDYSQNIAYIRLKMGF